MADKKITELTNITGANLVDADEFVVVDISADETKAITLGELKEAFDSGSGFVRITGDTMTGDLGLSGADVTFGDNDKAIFGAGSDLQIYHDGSNSYIKENGTGQLVVNATNLYLRNSNNTQDYLTAVENGATKLLYADAPKLATTSTGIDVTGTVTADGLTVDGNGTFQTTGATSITLKDTDVTESPFNFNIENGGRDGRISVWQDVILSNTVGTLARFNNGGDIAFYEDTGTTPKMVWKSADERLGIGTSSPATTLDVAGTTTTDGLNLSAIAATIADTAVDIFVYDTRKDSDGGAWRKRTQHTSWYNETLNTATRGSRKEFPAVAVIVAESSQVTIYDGDDPDLPMWAVLDANTTLTSVFARNGLVCPTSASAGVVCWNFVSETLLRYISTGKQSHIWTRDVTGSNFVTVDATAGIVSNVVNDVAMTVLPNAPIDAATGLPVPTIAVATDGGVSVIKDDGTVVDNNEVYIGDNTADYIDFTSDNKLYFVTRGKNYPIITEIPSVDQTDVAATDIIFWPNNVTTSSGKDVHVINNTNITDISSLYNNGVSFGGPKGVILVNDTSEITGDDTGVVAQVTSTYTTGWMNGDIKLATLSDTDDTNVTGSELVTNGTFDTDTSGWSSITSTLSVVSNALQIEQTSGTGWAYQGITTVVGKTYTLSLDVKQGTTPNYRVYVGTTAGDSSLYYSGTLSAGASFATLSATFTATSTTTVIQFGPWAASTDTILFDNISVRLAEEDRSVNGNGLQVFGTVTKSAVSSGADLVGYSGFSTSNYLEQPYNADLDWGTGDFCIMGWFKVSTTATQRICGRNNVSTSSKRFSIYTTGGLLYLYLNDSAVSQATASINTSNVWQHFVCKRENGGIKVYINGVGGVGASSTQDLTTNQPLYVGGENFGAGMDSPMTLGSLALFRISSTIPTDEQIAKIYRDEAPLFQEGAQATLYGESDAVTALAYDDSTNLLHVGTSAGRSVFQGLRRVDNTTTAVGAAISASNGLVADE